MDDLFLLEEFIKEALLDEAKRKKKKAKKKAASKREKNRKKQSRHHANYDAPEGSSRDAHLDKCKADLKRAKELRKKGQTAKAKKIEQSVYRRREAEEKKHR